MKIDAMATELQTGAAALETLRARLVGEDLRVTLLSRDLRLQRERTDRALKAYLDTMDEMSAL